MVLEETTMTRYPETTSLRETAVVCGFLIDDPSKGNARLDRHRRVNMHSMRLDKTRHYQPLHIITVAVALRDVESISGMMRL